MPGSQMIKIGRFQKKKDSDDIFWFKCKVQKGHISGKLSRQICNALNEAVCKVLSGDSPE